MDLNGKVVLLTGASDGIGAASAHVFHRRGARLVLVARTRDKLERVAGEAGGAVAVTGDITRPEVRQQAIDAALGRFGRIDVLVNNAGVGMYVPAFQADMAQVRAMYELNVFAALELVQLVVPHMRAAGGGMIVNVSSIAGKVPLPWFTNYTATKFALCATTDTLRIELKPFHIRCLTVCPGYVKTGFQDHSLAGRPPDRLWAMKKFAISAEQCAEALVRGVEREKRTVTAPALGALLQPFYILAPGIGDRILERIYRGLKMGQ
jgi:short-subunit dehydrogenase